MYMLLKPVVENLKTVWTPDRCECGSYKAYTNDEGLVICEGCKKPREYVEVGNG